MPCSSGLKVQFSFILSPPVTMDLCMLEKGLAHPTLQMITQYFSKAKCFISAEQFMPHFMQASKQASKQAHKGPSGVLLLMRNVLCL